MTTPSTLSVERDGTVGETWRRVVRAVCATYGVTPGDLSCRRRYRRVARPRQVVMYLATTHLGLSTVVVGSLLGGRDHTTVMHGRNVIAGMVQSNSIMRQRVEEIRANAGVG